MSNTDRDAAILWARQMTEQEFVVLDTETTGLESDDEAVSIGLVAKDGAILLNTLLCHEKQCSPKALATHGVSWEATRGAPHFREVWPHLIKATRDKILIGYNLSFGTRIIGQTGQRYSSGIIWGPMAGVVGLPGDVMEQFAAFYGDWNDYYGSYRWQKLTTAAAHFGLSVVGAHGAVADALLTLAIVRKMAETKLSTEEN